MAIKVFFL